VNTILKEYILPTGQSIQIAQGDITIEEVDAIVNAANEHLQHGGGVAWAISKKGGPTIQKESNDWIREHGRVSHSHPALTSGGLLPAKYVIHTVGPIYGHHRGEEAALLAACYENSIALAAKHSLATIAFPAISTGVYGYPREEAAQVTRVAILGALARHPGIVQVRLVFFSERDAEIARRA